MTQALPPCSAIVTRFSPAETNSKKETTSQALPVAPVPSLFEVLLDYFKQASGVKNAGFKTVSCISEWIFTFRPDLTQAKAVSTANKDAKNWLALSEIPGKAVDVVQSADSLYQNGNVGAFGALANKVGALIIPVVDVLTVANDKLSVVTAAAMQSVKTVSSAALVFTTSYGSVEELQKIHALQATQENATDPALKERAVALKDAKITESWMKIAMMVSYGTIGVIGLAGTYAGLVVAPWVVLALATSGLAFILLAQIQKKTVLEPALANHQFAIAQKV